MKMIVSADRTERTITVHAKSLKGTPPQCLGRADAIMFAMGWLAGRGEREDWAFSKTNRVNQNIVDVGFRRVGKEGR